MKYRFRILNADPLYDYREAGKITEGIDLNGYNLWKPEKQVEFWIKQIVANHSTVRSVHFRLVAEAPKSVIMQLIRATKGTPRPYVQSSRPDWNNGKERSSDPYEERLYIHDHTAESFIEMCKQRLCERTEKRTRDFVWELVDALRSSNEPFLKAVGYCCHPACWWLKGCPEISGCGSFSKISEQIIKDYINEK